MAEALLYLTHRIPYPPNKGDKIRSYHLLRSLSRHYQVFLGTFVDDPADWQYLPEVERLCAEVCAVGLDPARARLASLPALAGPRPLTLAYYRSRRLRAWARRACDAHGVRRALVFSAAVAPFVPARPDLRRVVDLVDVDSEKWRAYAAAKSWPVRWLYRREARTLLAYERALAAASAATLFVSTAEAELFRRLAPESAGRVAHFNNGVDAEYFSPNGPHADPYGGGGQVIVFTGAMDYWPNVDAVTWFAASVFPGVRAACPEARFVIVGGAPAPAVRRLASQAGVDVTGRVADVRPYLAHADVAVAPLRIARGVQNKVLEAMAMARPVIASPEAAEGIRAVAGRELYIARTPQEWQSLLAGHLNGARPLDGAEGRARVLADYDWEANLARVRDWLEGGAGRPAPAVLSLGAAS